MADYCIRCHEKINAGIPSVIKEHPWEYELEFGICEGCGKLSDNLVVGLRPSMYKKFRQHKRWIQAQVHKAK